MTRWPIDEKSPIAVILYESAQQIQEVCSSHPGVTALSHPAVLSFYLASIFYDKVRINGFRMLFTHLNGYYIREMEDVLILMNASRAHQYYTDAVKMCVENNGEYKVLLKDNNDPLCKSLRDQLDLHSMDYFREKPDFLEEISGYVLRELVAVKSWIIRTEEKI